MHFLIFPFLIGLFGILAMKKTASFSTCCLPNFHVICPKGIFQRQKTGSFCTKKPPFFYLQTTTGQYFCFAKTASPPDFFPVRIVVSPLFYACPPQRVISTTDSTCKEASIHMNVWRKFPLVWLYFP